MLTYLCRLRSCISINRLDYFQIQEDGELIPIDVDEFDPEDNEVFVVVENEARIIFLWKGKKAGVRQKFIGSRATGDKRKEYGYHYKIEVMDQGDETDAFIENVRGGEVVHTSPIQEESTEVSDGDPTMSESNFTSYAEAAAAQGIDVDDEEVLEKSGEKSVGDAPSQIRKMGGVGARPQRSFLSDPNFYSDVKKDKKTRQKVTGVLQETNKEEAIELVNALGSPSGFDREMLIVGQTVYRVKIENDQVTLEDLENPLDGVIMVQQYVPRLLCENGVIKAVELLKQTSEDIEIDESLTQDLEDLTAMFQIEVE